jgi:hypothetical protein
MRNVRAFDRVVPLALETDEVLVILDHLDSGSGIRDPGSEGAVLRNGSRIPDPGSRP